MVKIKPKKSAVGAAQRKVQAIELRDTQVPGSPSGISPTGATLLGDIRALIDESRQLVASTVNAELTLLFWRIGQRIHTEVLVGRRAGYGEEILPTLAGQLARDYGRGFGEKNLRRMVKFAATFHSEPIVATLSRQLSWSHLVLLLALKEPLQRDYYAQIPAGTGCGF